MAHEWKFPCKLDSNYDGDTFRLEIDIGFALRHYAPVRLHGADTPELRGGTELTKAAARLARDEAERFIRDAAEVMFHCVVWGGKYGRPVGDIICDGQSLAAWLIEEGLAVPYDGGSRTAIQVLHEENAQSLLNAGRITLES